MGSKNKRQITGRHTEMDGNSSSIILTPPVLNLSQTRTGNKRQKRMTVCVFPEVPRGTMQACSWTPVPMWSHPWLSVAVPMAVRSFSLRSRVGWPIARCSGLCETWPMNRREEESFDGPSCKREMIVQRRELCMCRWLGISAVS